MPQSKKLVQSRELLFQVLEDLDIPFLFGLEGTTELPLIDGCAEHPQVKYVQVLHENIAVGAASGYGRMTRPALRTVGQLPGQEEKREADQLRLCRRGAGGRAAEEHGLRR